MAEKNVFLYLHIPQCFRMRRGICVFPEQKTDHRADKLFVINGGETCENRTQRKAQDQFVERSVMNGLQECLKVFCNFLCDRDFGHDMFPL